MIPSEAATPTPPPRGHYPGAHRNDTLSRTRGAVRPERVAAIEILLTDRLRDGLAHLFRARLPTHVARSRTFANHRLDRAHDGLARLLVTEVLEHHRARPDLPHRVRDPLPGDVRRGPVHRLEHRRVL